MAVVAWVAVAVLVGLGFAVMATRAARPEPRAAATPDHADAAAAPLQRVATWTLLAGLAFTLAVAGLIARGGVSAWWSDERVRLPVTALMLAALVACLAPMIRARRAVTAKGVVVDERDLAILERAPRVQGPAALVVLALWTAGLMEAFHAAGAVPVPYLVLLFWSCLLTYALALPVGILAGYRRG